MNESTNMSTTIVPRSDQINADDLIAGPRTITVREVKISPGTEQPVAIRFDGNEDRNYMPCKSMRRVLVALWGPDASVYVGRSMRLYRDPSVTWGGMEVGGIRISHMSHMEKETMIVLTATKKSRKPFTVSPLVVEAKPAKRTAREITREALEGCTTVAEVDAIANGKTVKDVLQFAPEDKKAEMQAIVKAAYARFLPSDDGEQVEP